MRIALFSTALAVALSLGLSAGQAAAQEPPKVINILVFDTGGQNDEFLEFAKRAMTLTKQLGSTGMQRVWTSTLAGPNTGTMVVAVEYPSFVSMAESQAKVGSSPEWQQFIDDFAAAGMRVTSSSVSVEVTPQ